MQHEFKKLQVYQRSLDLAECVLRFCDKIRPYRLSEQVAGSAISTPSNIAEGACRGSDAQFINFLYYSNGSVAELWTQLLLLKRIGKYRDIDYDSILDECSQIAKMLYALIESIKKRSKKPDR